MANSDPNVTRIRHDRFIDAVPLKAAAVVHKNDIILTQDADGFAVSAPAASCHCIGISMEDVDNTSGASGDKTVRVEQGVFLFANNSAGSDPVVTADVGIKALCYAESYNTLCHTSAGKSPVGRVVGLNEMLSASDVSLGVLVEIGPNS